MVEIGLIIFVAVLIGSSVVVSSIPKIMLISLKKRIFDPIDSRKVHTEAASRLGGVTFLPVIIIVSLLAIMSLRRTGLIMVNLDDYAQLGAVLASLLILYFVGLYDDIVSVKYRNKFIFQIITALWIIGSGVVVGDIYLLTDTYTLSEWVAVPLTVLVVVFITNAINLIDGVNGLASMLSIMAFAVYGIIFFLMGDFVDATLCFVAIGALAPFFYHNVFGVRRRTKARVFMGDCGALVLGLLLSVMAIKIWDVNVPINSFISANLCHVLVYTMLFVPCMDVVRVVIHRAMDHHPLFMPDKNHIHHKFMRLGFTPQLSLLPIIGFQLFFVFFNIALSTQLNFIYILLIDCILWTILHVWMSRIIKSREMCCVE